jgi:hypothetical protein
MFHVTTSLLLVKKNYSRNRQRVPCANKKRIINSGKAPRYDPIIFADSLSNYFKTGRLASGAGMTSLKISNHEAILFQIASHDYIVICSSRILTSDTSQASRCKGVTT